MAQLVKVELGCGRTKTKGYLGIDRFPLPGVDMVADLDKGIPLADNSVDVLFACHSLEHFADLRKIMTEIYRVCKHGAIIHILSPHYNTTTNLSNIYHKQVFNEDTFRFFGTDEQNPFIDPEDWYCPHACSWGLENSDNSESTLNFIQIGVEFFYYKEYRHLTPDQQRHVRRAFSNVCDQLLYTLIVKKDDELSMEQLTQLKVRAKELEPPIVEALRKRDSAHSGGSSVLTDIQEQYSGQIGRVSETLRGEISVVMEKLGEAEKRARQAEETLAEQVAQLAAQMEGFAASMGRLKTECADAERRLSAAEEKNKMLREQMGVQASRELYFERCVALTVLAGESTKKRMERPSSRHLVFWKRRTQLYVEIQKNFPDFSAKVTMHYPQYRFDSHAAVCLSPPLPRVSYFEYQLVGRGKHLVLFFLGTYGTHVEVEIVCDDVICEHQILTLECQNIYTIAADLHGRIGVRLKVAGDSGAVRTLEISKRMWGVFEKNQLAAYVE